MAPRLFVGRILFDFLFGVAHPNRGQDREQCQAKKKKNHKNNNPTT